MAISSPGVGSNLDVNSIVSQLMRVEQQPLAQLNTKEASYQTRLSALGGLKGSLSNLQSAFKSLSDPSRFSAISASLSDSSIATASGSAGAQPGTYALNVTKLAQAEKLASTPYASADQLVGSGTLVFTFGTSSGGTFTANANKTPQTVTIDAAHGTLSGVRDAINAANVGVSASIVNDGSGYRLVMSGKDSGTINNLQITSSSTSGDLSVLNNDPTGVAQKLTELQAAQNAEFTVDGLSISKASNNVTDVLDGVSLKLTKAGTTNLTIGRDTGGATKAINDLVKAYNDFNTTASNLGGYDADTKKGGPLQGDATLRTVKNQLRNAFNKPITGLTGNFTSLAQIGITFQRDGSLKLDSTKLQSAMSSDLNNVISLFASNGSATDSLVNYSSSTSSTQSGQYALNLTAVASGGSFAGSAIAAAPITIDGTNNTFALKVNGVQSGNISLTQQAYASNSSLAIEMQSKINNDATLKAAGVSVAVTYDTQANHFTLTSSKIGSTSTVEVTTANATLGLAAGVGVAGVDNVAGTIGGFAAIGEGQYLTGDKNTPVFGLKLQILGGAAGDRGSVSFSRGYAAQVGKAIDDLLADGGSIDAATKSVNQSIKNLDHQRDSLNTRLAATEKRYRSQFTSLDVAIGQMTQMSNYMTQQLARLP